LDDKVKLEEENPSIGIITHFPQVENTFF